MAKYLLQNAVNFRGTIIPAGKTIDDKLYNITQLQGAGAVLQLLADADASAVAAQLLVLKQRGQDIPIDLGTRQVFPELEPGQAVAWAQQATWFIDPTNGLDTNDGLTSTTALKTHSELERRWGLYPGGVAFINQVTTVTLLGDILASNNDGVRVYVRFGKNGFLKYVGTPVAVYTNTSTGVSAVTTINRATNTPWDVTDAGVPTGTWSGAGFIGKRVRIPTGPRAGATFWAVKDLAAGKVRISAPCTYTPVQGNNGFPTLVTPLANDPIIVENLTRVDRIDVSIETPIDLSANANAFFLAFQDIDTSQVSATTQGNVLRSGTASTVIGYFGCWTNAAGINCVVRQTGCKQTGGGVYLSGNMVEFMANYFTQRFSVNTGARVTVDFDTISQGSANNATRVRWQGSLLVGSWGIFDATSDAIDIQPGAHVMGEGANSGTYGLYGSGNGGVGVNVHTRAKMDILTLANCTLTGTGGDFKVGGAASGYAWDDANHVYTAAKHNYTWALLAASVATGFGNNIVDPLSGGSIGLTS